MSESKNTLKSVPLENRHIELGGKMVPFGGWNMPVQYTGGIISEHDQTRNHVSIFDCSHMGQFRVRGNSAATDLDRLFPRLVSNQKLNSCRYNFLLGERGTVLDDLIVYRISAEEFYIVVNGATIASDFDYIRDHLSKHTECINESNDTIKLDVQGPQTVKMLKEHRLVDDHLPTYYQFIFKEIKGVPCLMSRTGYTGELGFEFYLPVTDGERFWDMLTRGAMIKPAGLGARDTLRLEMGYPLYGHELNDDVTPIEAGFGKILNLDHDFIGKDALTREPRKRLVGIRFEGRRAVREGSSIADSTGQTIGMITSGSYSPSLKCAIAMGYIAADAIVENGKVSARCGKSSIFGTIEPFPFYKHGSVRN